MNHQSIPTLRPTMEELRNQFETWRKTRQQRAPIPDALWRAAVSLSKDYSILQISKALRLNYNDLKKHTQALYSVCTPEREFPSCLCEPL